MNLINDFGIKLLNLDTYFEKDTYFVYGLVDPRTNKIAYIGITKNLKQRYYGHITTSKNKSKKHSWIKKLKSLNLKPKMEILCVCHKLMATKYEFEYIQKYKNLGYDLKNTQESESTLCFKAVSVRKQEVCGLNLKTREIVKFKSIQAAAKALKLNNNLISLSSRHKSRIVNHTWLFSRGHDIASLLKKELDIINYRKPRPVYSINKLTGLKIEYQGLKDACLKTGINYYTIKTAIYAKSISHNCTWFFGDKDAV